MTGCSGVSYRWTHPGDGSPSYDTALKESLMTIYGVLLVVLVGLLMYGFAANVKAQEIGRIMFWTGLLAFLLRYPWLQTFTLLK